MRITAGILAGALALAVGSQASAATLTATVLDQPYGDFSIEFFDNNGNSLLDFNEISSFSGVIFSPGEAQQFYGSILGVPEIPLYAVAGATPLLGLSPSEWEDRGIWLFAEGLVRGEAFPTNWRYEITGLSTGPTVVPLPAGLPLLLASLGALALLRRRRAAAA